MTDFIEWAFSFDRLVRVTVLAGIALYSFVVSYILASICFLLTGYWPITAIMVFVAPVTALYTAYRWDRE